jgi:hypothetical protein
MIDVTVSRSIMTPKTRFDQVEGQRTGPMAVLYTMADAGFIISINFQFLQYKKNSVRSIYQLLCPAVEYRPNSSFGLNWFQGQGTE